MDLAQPAFWEIVSGAARSAWRAWKAEVGSAFLLAVVAGIVAVILGVSLTEALLPSAIAFGLALLAVFLWHLWLTPYRMLSARLDPESRAWNEPPRRVPFHYQSEIRGNRILLRVFNDDDHEQLIVGASVVEVEGPNTEGLVPPWGLGYRTAEAIPGAARPIGPHRNDYFLIGSVLDGSNEPTISLPWAGTAIYGGEIVLTVSLGGVPFRLHLDVVEDGAKFVPTARVEELVESS